MKLLSSIFVAASFIFAVPEANANVWPKDFHVQPKPKPVKFPEKDLSFQNYLIELTVKAKGKGVSDNTIINNFRGLEADRYTIARDGMQFEKTINFDEYLEKVLPKSRINRARSELAANKIMLDKVSAKYGVQPEYIVALWAIESNFGERTGSFDLITSLASLAYEGRRRTFFEGELMAALTILDQGHISRKDLQGSWAGATGQCQFMPSSFTAYAQDFNGDGKKDIWNTKEDVFASIANYLSKSGWKKGIPAAQITPDHKGNIVAQIKQKGNGKARREFKTLNHWSKNLQIPLNNLPTTEKFAAVAPFENQNDKFFLISGNYNVIMKWNRSIYFATTVSILAESIKL